MVPIAEGQLGIHESKVLRSTWGTTLRMARGSKRRSSVGRRTWRNWFQGVAVHAHAIVIARVMSVSCRGGGGW